MHPQSQLENYKLQVELLQEKLYRSEDTRKELEKKLEQIMKKRKEHERTLRSKSQLKYQQFLDEQRKRNERNRKLVEMLERIDQQAAELSAKSERFKMMKLQHELYFSKLVQSYTMKSLQVIPQASILGPSKIKNTSITDGELIATGTLNVPSNPSVEIPQFKRVSLPLVIPIPNEKKQCQSTWTYGSVPQGVLIALPNNVTLPMSSDNVDNKESQSNLSFDYSQFPIGYLQTTPTPAMQYNVTKAYLQPHIEQKPLEEHNKNLLLSDKGYMKKLESQFELKVETPSSILYPDVKTDDIISSRVQSNQSISEHPVFSNKTEKCDDLRLHEDKDFQNLKQTEELISNKDFSAPHQSLKVDKLPNIKLNSSFQHQRNLEKGIAHEENKPNTIDFRTENDNKYIKNTKAMEQTYQKKVLTPISLNPQELNVDNITTTLQAPKTGKINELNVGEDEKINDTGENENNTSSASSVPFDSKYGIESVGDEVFTSAKKPLKNKTNEHISKTSPARNIDACEDAEQITLVNGTNNFQDESTRVSNSTTTIFDGDEGENKKNTLNTRMNQKNQPTTNSNQPLTSEKKEKMSIENIETAIYGELLMKPATGEFSDGAEQRPRQSNGYEITDPKQELHEQQDLHEQDPVIGKEESPHATEIQHIDKQHDEFDENNQVNYPYNQFSDEQQYDMHNYGYSDPNTLINPEGVSEENYAYAHDGQSSVNNYEVTNFEGVPQDDYSYMQGGQTQGDNYTADYQNYSADPNEYQYNYNQTNYDDTTQPQCAPDSYIQEYQEDQYAREYSNYEQDAPNEGRNINVNENDVYSHAGEYENEENYKPEQEVVLREKDDKKVSDDLVEELSEENTKSQLNESSEQKDAQRTIYPASILSTEKSDSVSKKKKRVNFVDSETDSSTQQKMGTGGVSSESDFDFSNN